MTIKREAAYHEAAHAFVAHQSRFHEVVGPISLAEYGAGEVFVGLQKSKLKSAGKVTGAQPERDPEVAREAALIFTAGYVAEQIAAESDQTLSPNVDCALPDHDLVRQQLSGAGLSSKFDRAESEVRELLKKNWSVVKKLADHLFENQKASFDEIITILDTK